jgi:hypothetical protein
MRFRAVVLAGFFCLAMLGAVPGASAQGAELPNGYTLPVAAIGGTDHDDWTYGDSIDDPLAILIYRATENPDTFGWDDPVNSIDPSTGEVTFGSDDDCYLGVVRVEVSSGGQRAAYSGYRDCAKSSPRTCLTSSGKLNTNAFCSFRGSAHTSRLSVYGCFDKASSSTGICTVARHTAALKRSSAKRRLTVRWRVTFNGSAIGSGRLRVATQYLRRIRAVKGHRIYSDSNFDAFYNYCLSDPWPKTYSSGGRIYCWHPVSYEQTGRAAALPA